MNNYFKKISQLASSWIKSIHGLFGNEDFSEEKDEFVAIVSHQLRTPVSALLGYMSLLRDGNYGKLTSEQLNVINKSLKITLGMERMIDNFLSVSHAERGVLKFHFEKTDLRDIIDEVAERHEMQAKRKELQIKWLRPDNPVYIDADIGKLSNVFSNILDNALKYTEKGGVSIRILEDKRKGIVEIFIKDTGMGITSEDEKNIFKSFYRGKKVHNIEPAGAGLGLHVARMVIEGHGGTIRIEGTKEGAGTTFAVELPDMPEKIK
ncbi:MAG: HAMP domain-containing sensor histidine kinase [Candidatus Spechtbacterales bacterium]